MEQPATRIHCFEDSADFGRRLARRAAIGMAMVRVHRFPDGESGVRVRGPSGRHALVLRSLHRPNQKILEVGFAADALRRAGARRVSLIAPYFAYMRQDAVFRSGEANSQRVVCRWLAASFDGLLTLEPHLHRLRDLREFFPRSRAAISAAPLFAGWLRRAGEPVLLVGPDAESGPWIRRIARDSGCPWVVGGKLRKGDAKVEIVFDELPPARRALIVDDIASSGATIEAAARALRRRGVARVDAGVVHAVFAPGAERRIRAAGVRTLFSCNSIPHRSNQLDATGLFAASIVGGAR